VTTTSAFYGRSSEADAARPGRAGVELADEHDVAIRIDDLELAGAHGERVLDRADLDVCDNELCAQRAGVVGPAVEEHRLLRRVDRSVRRRDHQAGTGGTAVGRRGGPGGPREHLAVDMAVPHLQAESGVERDRAMEVGDVRVGRQRVDAHATIPSERGTGPHESGTRPGYASPMRRYHVTTFGCQMNAHDSERIKGMLESLGIGEAASPDDADVLVFNTCTIREKPDTRLAAHLGDAAARKRREPDVVVAVGGCYAEAQRDLIFERYPFVDVAFGPGSIPHLGEWIEAGGRAVPRGRFGTHETFAATLPMHRERRYSAWVQVSMGCNSTCAYCIVPAVRGREQSRRPGEIVAELEALARDGVKEVTLLGQNVNSWGRDLAPGIRTEFGELLRACDAVDGIERIRFTSPHPKDFRAPVIAAIAECGAVCEHVHLPLQSGSTRVLKAMRRTYTREKYLALVERLRASVPDLALGTDIIVGFPGETERDFEETLEVVEEVAFDSAFTFVYSPRAGTEAATMPEQIPDDVKRDRMERLVAVVQRGAAARNAARVGRVEEVLAEGPSRTDPTLLRGRTRRNTTVNFVGSAAAGDLVHVRIEGSTSTTLRGREAALVPA
jgi:tRNA-2-methylthio-N6-dimethylallyladenosine synthase